MRATTDGDETTAEILADVRRKLDRIEERERSRSKVVPGLDDWRRAQAEEDAVRTTEDRPSYGVPEAPPPGALDSRVPTLEQVARWGAAMKSLLRDNESLLDMLSETLDPSHRPLVTRGGVGGRSALTHWREQNLGGLIVTMRRLRAMGRASGVEAGAILARTEGVADLAALSVGYPENLSRARMLDNARVALTHRPTARLLANPDPIFNDLRASVTSQALLGAGPPGSRAIFERSAERPETRAPAE